MRKQWISLSIGVLMGTALPAAEDHVHSYGEQLGRVELTVSCNEEAAGEARRGLALMHHMTYEGARDAFTAATVADPECAMGYWGQAMTYIHPLWSDPPSEADFERGRSLLATARARGPKTELESAYIAAAEAYYAAGRGPKEQPNLAAFERGWEAVHKQFPDDPEAACLYALAHLATADPADKTYAKQKRSGEIAEGVLSRFPDHAGAHHYAIHSYDYPPLAARALKVARSYAKIAPAVPHALHMPTHIFTRLGLWSESIEGNRRSAEVALGHSIEGAVSMHHLHALDYLAYAHLQREEDRHARQVAEHLAALTGPFQIEVATPYAFAAVPARLALERQRWAEAAALEPRDPGVYPWDRFPAIEAITHFARALGAARSGQPEVARQALERMAELRDQASGSSAYWAQQVEIQRLSALAWLIWQEGRKEEGLATMRAAADLEASTEKHPVTPGEVLPARELLADMLFEAGRLDEARAAYEATLARSPNRLNALYGAGRAAEQAGDAEAARKHFQQIVDSSSGGEAEGDRLAYARSFLRDNRIGG